MKMSKRKLADSILRMVLPSFNGRIHYAKHQAGKPRLETSMTKIKLLKYVEQNSF